MSIIAQSIRHEGGTVEGKNPRVLTFENWNEEEVHHNITINFIGD